MWPAGLASIIIFPGACFVANKFRNNYFVQLAFNQTISNSKSSQFQHLVNQLNRININFVKSAYSIFCKTAQQSVSWRQTPLLFLCIIREIFLLPQRFKNSISWSKVRRLRNRKTTPFYPLHRKHVDSIRSPHRAVFSEIRDRRLQILLNVYEWN